MIGALKDEKMAYVDSEESEKGDKQSQGIAFVLYWPKSKVSKEGLWYNESALRILTFSLSPSDFSSDRMSDISAFCSRWAKSLENKRTTHKFGESLSPETDFIDIIVSGRRQYGVRGFVLAPEKQKQYFFILERTGLENAHLEMIFRHCNLNKDL